MLFILVFSVIPSSFFNRISNVFFTCSNPKVIWSNTWRVVAGMTNKKSLWDSSIMNSPRNSMGFYEGWIWIGFYSYVLKKTIPFIGFSASPYPTCICFFDSAKKSRNAYFGKINLHRKYLLSVSWLRRLKPCGAFILQFCRRSFSKLTTPFSFVGISPAY